MKARSMVARDLVWSYSFVDGVEGSSSSGTLRLICQVVSAGVPCGMAPTSITPLSSKGLVPHAAAICVRSNVHRGAVGSVLASLVPLTHAPSSRFGRADQRSAAFGPQGSVMGQ